MANIKKIENKSSTSYQITVSHGRDVNKKQIRHFMTWTPPEGLTPRKLEKELERVAADFERDIKLGYVVDNKQTFGKYAEYVIGLKESGGIKHRTVELYKSLMERINEGIGHLKLVEVRPQHLNGFYKNLSEAGIRKGTGKATARVDLSELLKTKMMTREALSKSAGISQTTVNTAFRNQKITLTKADAIARVLDAKTADVFAIEKDKTPLSPKTVLQYHRFISTVLDQAEKEMLVQYNAASKATPPKQTHNEVNYFQPADILQIQDALESEPIKWRMFTHLLLITGCRRGEIAGLKWSKIDFKNNQLKIDSALLYAQDRGVYEDTTKTGAIRFVKLPAESMQLLKQYKSWHAELQLKSGSKWQNKDFVFTQDNGLPMNPDSVTSWLRDFSRRHGLPHINPHAFRHTMASILINSGKDVVAVSKRLGHSKVSTTTDIYSHVIEEADAQASECLADVMLRKGEKAIG
ncbi:Site-specific recombinase XerD [Sporobacter termitidis DSM 10068]|uniref:Site-specific recombinase XerD n=1 Tax=Sporobacter termitidis DSM 10068 TaxID=1123282 RepID=A0A1M5Z5X7_9FIRM|nr:tyrosine-type recombinase/integrase [Sporobacter termitidis]SHI19685.1 Site-specific recombinase XerD [Sporobacter termitidis DSM 10068]